MMTQLSSVEYIIHLYSSICNISVMLVSIFQSTIGKYRGNFEIQLLVIES